MSEATFAVGNFSGGEISKFAQGRFDKPEYRTSLKVCLNSFPDELGVWGRRPGTQFLGATRNGLPGRVYSFDFKQQVPYAVELTNGNLRFWAGTRLVTDASSAVLSISAATPAVVTVAADIGMVGSTKELIFSLNPPVNNVPPLLLNRVFVGSRLSATTFSLFDGITFAAIDGSTLGAYVASGAVASRIFEISTAYVLGSSNDWASVQIVQAETQGIMLNGNIPQLLNATVQPTPTSFASFTLTAMDTLLLDGPYLDAGTTLTSTSILTIQGDGSFLITAGVFPDPRAAGLVAADVGRHVRLFSEPKQWPGSGTGAVGDIVSLGPNFFARVYYRQLTAAAITTPGTSLTDWAVVPLSSVALWTWGRIATVVSPIRFTVTIAGGPLLYTAAGTTINIWQLGLYGNALGWPTCGVYHEGRLWLSGVIDNRIDGSMSNNLLTFAPTNPDGTVAANNAISAVFNASDVNAIFWMNSDDRGIICGTQGGEWLVSAPTTGPMAPNNIKVARATKIGCANVEPRRAGNTLVFVQRHQRKIMEYFPDVYSGRLTSPSLTVNAKHLTGTRIQEMAGYQQELAPLLWSRMGDGSLKGVTYKRENLNSTQGPNFCGWHRHTLGSGRTILSVCMGSSDGNLDNLMMVTTDGSVGHVEMMTNIFEETSALKDAWFLDDAVAVTSSKVAADFSGITLNGLWHLNGKTVQVFAGGLDCGDRGDANTVAHPFTDFVVANGSVFVPFGDSISAGPGRGLFTNEFVATNPPIVVGFTYDSDGQMVKPIAPADSGARNGPALGKLTRAHRYAMTLVNTLGIKVGGTFAKLRPAKYETTPPAVTMFTGIAQDGANDDDGYDNGWCWRISRPFPANVIAVALNLNTKDQ